MEKAAENLIPVLCKFWEEDGVWNGIANDLPVAVFGKTFEQTRSNLLDAIISHLEAVYEGGDIERLLEELREKGRTYLPVDEISPDSPMVKILVAMQGQEIHPVTF